MCPARAVQSFDQAETNRITSDREDDGYRCAGILRCTRGSNIPRCGNGRYAQGHKLRGKFRQFSVDPFSPPLLDADVITFDKSCFAIASRNEASPPFQKRAIQTS